MTTVVYHNNTLAADRRIKYFDFALGTLKESYCNHCNTKSETITVSNNKIVLIDGISIEGDNVLAVAGTGSTIHSDKLIKLMKKGHHPNLIIELCDGMTTDWMETFTMMFVCEKSVRILEYWSGNVNWKNHTRDETVIIGSGGPGALLAINHLKVNAIDAIKLAAIGDTNTGNGAVYIDLNQEKLEVIIDEKELKE